MQEHRRQGLYGVAAALAAVGAVLLGVWLTSTAPTAHNKSSATPAVAWAAIGVLSAGLVLLILGIFLPTQRNTDSDETAGRDSEHGVAPAIELDRTGQDHSSQRGPQRLVRHNLGHRQFSRLLGRDLEVTLLREQLAPGSPDYLRSVRGLPGTGKTSLAYEVASYFVEGGHSGSDYRNVVWVAAPTTVLQPMDSGLGSINRLEDLFTHIATVLEVTDILRLPASQIPVALRRELSNSPTLLVVDNFETVDDARIPAFLQAIPAPTKVLLTSRETVTGVDDAELHPLDETSTEELIRVVASDRSVALTPEQVTELARTSGNLPLVVVWAIAQLDSGFTYDSTMARLLDADGDLLGALFGQALSRIRRGDAHDLLLALSLFATSANRDMLGHTAGLGSDIVRRDRAITQLRGLSLIDLQLEDRFSLLPIVKRMLTGDLEDRRDFVAVARSRQISATVDFLQRFNPRQEPSPPVQPFWVELENVRHLVRWCAATQDADSLVQLAAAYAPFLWAHGLFDELFDLVSTIKAPAMEIGSWKELADIALQAVLAHMDQFDPEQMNTTLLEVVDEAFQHLDIVPDELLETSMFTKAAMASLRGDSNAKQLLELDLAFARQMGVNWRIAGTYYWFGLAAYAESDWQEAYDRFTYVVDSSGQVSDYRTMALGYAYLPEVLYNLGNHDEAIAVEQEARAVVEAHGQKTSKAQLDLGSAEILVRTALANLETATLRATSALEQFSELKRRSEVGRATQLVTLLNSLLEDLRAAVPSTSEQDPPSDA